MALTYDELIRLLPVQLNSANEAFVAELPTIVREAEEELYLTLDHDAFRGLISTESVEPGSQVIDLSTADPKVLEIRSIRFELRTEHWMPLVKRDIEYLRTLYSSQPSGRPTFYAEDESPLKVEIFPRVSRAYNLRIAVNQYPPALGPATQTNTLTADYPRAMTMAAYFRGALFNRDTEKAASFKEQMLASLTQTNAQIARRRRDETEPQPRPKANATGV